MRDITRGHEDMRSRITSRVVKAAATVVAALSFGTAAVSYSIATSAPATAPASHAVSQDHLDNTPWG
jgi:hypothetical protein